MPTRVLLAAIAAIALAGAAPAQASPLTGVARTAHFELRFRPGSPAEAAVDRTAALVEDELARILKELGLAGFEHTVVLWLYDDVPELQRLTGVRSAGHSTTLQSHLPCDNDQTRVHELVHVVAEQFTETGSEPRNLFFAEGLANAVLRFVTGVHVDAVAAFHRRRGDLPALAEISALPDFYAWLRAHPHLDCYDVAGSWMRFLLDRHGAAAVRRYYKGVPPQAAFGQDLAALEQAWHEHLDRVTLRPGTLALLQQRYGRNAAERNPADAQLGEAQLGPAAAWHAQAPDTLVSGDPARTEQHDGASVLRLSGEKSQGDWCVARLGADALGDAIVRCTFEPGPGCYGVQVQLGGRCQGMVLRGQGAFLYNEGGCAAHEGGVQLGDRPVQLVLRRQRGVASVWIDGRLVLEGRVDSAAAPFGVGCVGGPARCRDAAVRRL